MQDGTSETQDLMQFLSDTDYPSLGNRPSTWRDCVLALKDEMATHVVIRAAATLLSLNVNIIDWNGVSYLAYLLVKSMLKTLNNHVHVNMYVCCMCLLFLTLSLSFFCKIRRQKSN